jgi:uncharacterized membrane protein YoaK (UPF0700 family)
VSAAAAWRRDPTVVLTLLVLTAVAGGVDAVAYLHLGGVFISNQTGNLLLLAMSASGKQVVDVGAALASFLFFLAGVMVTAGWFRVTADPHGRSARSALLLAAAAVLLLAGAGIVTVDPTAHGIVVIPLAVAMGAQAAYAAHVGLRFLTTGFVTGSTVSAAMASPFGERTDRAWWYAAFPLVAIGIGAAVAAIGASYDVVMTLAAAAGLVAMTALLLGLRTARTPING